MIIESNEIKFEYKYLKTYLLDIMVSFIVLLIPTLVYLVCIIILGNRVITLAIIIVVISLQIFMSVLIIPYLLKDFSAIYWCMLLYSLSFHFGKIPLRICQVI